MIPQVWEASTSKHEGLINEHGAFRAPKGGGRPFDHSKSIWHTSSIDGLSNVFHLNTFTLFYNPLLYIAMLDCDDVGLADWQIKNQERCGHIMDLYGGKPNS